MTTVMELLALEVIEAVVEPDDEVAGPTGVGAMLETTEEMIEAGKEVLGEGENVARALERTETALVVEEARLAGQLTSEEQEVMVSVVVDSTVMMGTTTGTIAVEDVSAPGRTR